MTAHAFCVIFLFIPGIHPRDAPESKNVCFPCTTPNKQKQRHSRSWSTEEAAIDQCAKTTDRKTICLFIALAQIEQLVQVYHENYLETKQKLEDACKKLKGLKQVLKRRDGRISKLLADVRNKDPISSEDSWTCKT